MDQIIKFKNDTSRHEILDQLLNYLEIKHLADLENHYKQECLIAVKQYQQWKKAHLKENDALEKLYGDMKGIILRQHAGNAVQLYWTMRQDFRTVFKHRMAPYLDQESHQLTTKAA